MLLVQVDEAGASNVVDGRDVSSADAASAGMVKVRVLFSSFDQFHVNACACRYISCSTPLVLLTRCVRMFVYIQFTPLSCLRRLPLCMWFASS